MPAPCPVVISGISGRFPESSNCEEFKQNLYNGVDMISNDSRRWPPGLYGAPSRTGKIKDIASFDAEFFGIHSKLANVMDPQLRMLLELTHESIMDAGFNPEEVRGTRTGVYIGLMTTEANDYAESSPETLTGYETIGATRAMLANRLSYAFNFSGPCCTIDTACSSTLFGLHLAVGAIERGECDHAIIGGVNLTLKPATSLMYHKYNMLSPTGTISPFDAAANGYVRSEAAVVIFVTRNTSSHRIYCHIMGTATNTDGHKKQGQTYPSSMRQAELMREVYEKTGVNPVDVGYVEAHGTGTSVGDVQETNAITEVFCQNRPSPLLIGSVKSNCGHTEPASGLVSIAKAIFTFETSLLPPNINYRTPNPNIAGLAGGKLKVVDHVQPLAGEYIAINSFGVGGTNAHVLLKKYSSGQVPSQATAARIPRLLLAAGRTKENVDELLAKLTTSSTTSDLLPMCDQLYSVATRGYKIRGYSFLDSTKEAEIQSCDSQTRPVWFLFSGMGSQWFGMGRDLLQVDIFRATIEQCDEVLAPMNVSLRTLYENPTEEMFRNPIYVMTGVIGMQIGLVNILKALGIKPDGIVGHSTGELSCSYADGAFTLEETILAAYYRGYVLVETKPLRGSMVAVGLGWEEINQKLPHGIVAACHNSNESVTISGPQDEVRRFAEELKNEGVFAKEVDSLGYAFHSPYLMKAADLLRTKYKTFLNEGNAAKPRTSRWISTSFPESKWTSVEAQYCSVNYHLANVLSPVLFHHAMSFVPDNAVVIEIAPHPLLQAVLKRSLPASVRRVTLTNKTAPNQVETLLRGVGSLHLSGLSVQLSSLYGKVSYPVQRGTPMISPLVGWDHSVQYKIPSFLPKNNLGHNEVEINLQNEDQKSLAGHKINSRILFPAAGYMTLVWKALCKAKQEWFENVGVQFEDLRFLKPTVLSSEGSVHLRVTILPYSGHFEITENDDIVVEGKVQILNEDLTIELSPLHHSLTISREDIYKELSIRGYNYDGLYKGLLEANTDGNSGRVEWNADWTAYIDTVLQFRLLSLPHRDLRLPTHIQRVVIRPGAHKDSSKSGSYHQIEYNPETDTLNTSGVQIQGMIVTPTNKRKTQLKDPIFEVYDYHEYFPKNENNILQNPQYVLEILLELVLDNLASDDVRVLDLAENLNLTLAIKNIIERKPRKTVNLTVHSVGTPNPAFVSNHIRIVSDVSNGFSLKEDEKFHFVLVDQPLDNFGKLLKQETSVCVLCVHGGDIFLEESGLVEASRIVNGDKQYSILYKNSPQRSHLTPALVNVSPDSFQWVPQIQEILKVTGDSEDIVLINRRGDTVSGLVSLVKCLNLEYEHSNVRFRCVSIEDDYNLEEIELRKQISKNLVHNVFKQGTWGSYRHTLLDPEDMANNNVSTTDIYGKEVLSSSAGDGKVVFDAHKSYIVLGGLGGFGIELCDWMIQRNCHNLVISSRSGVQVGYQQYMLTRWQSSKINVKICTADVMQASGVQELIQVATSLGPVDGVFNLAGVLRDSIFENQTPDNFDLVYRTKVVSTSLLDQISRRSDDPWSYFVTFSSITSGRGNKGQTNYGYANACMESICEARRRDGLSGLSIQWGPISDVGMAAKLLGRNQNKIIGGAHAQTLDSCLSSLEILLQTSKAVVSSTVVPNKNVVTDETLDQGSGTLRKVVGDILGIQNTDGVSDSATLSDLGLDSLMAADVKNVLQTKFDITLATEQIKELKFHTIEALLPTKS